jgi:PGF-pre-PGF domain-containing protein
MGGGKVTEEITTTVVTLLDELVGRLTLSILEFQEQTIALVAKGVQQVLEFVQTDITGITFTLQNSASNLVIEVQKLLAKPTETPDASGATYRYFTVKTSGLRDADVEEASITFKVEKSWIESNASSVNSVQLQKYIKEDGNLLWKSLPTEKVSEDNESVYYKAQTPGFSIFAIAGERSETARVSLFAITAEAKSVPASNETPAATKAPTPTPVYKTPAEGLPMAAFGVLGVIIVAAAVAVVVLMKKKK